MLVIYSQFNCYYVKVSDVLLYILYLCGFCLTCVLTVLVLKVLVLSAKTVREKKLAT